MEYTTPIASLCREIATSSEPCEKLFPKFEIVLGLLKSRGYFSTFVQREAEARGLKIETPIVISAYAHQFISACSQALDEMCKRKIPLEYLVFAEKEYAKRDVCMGDSAYHRYALSLCCQELRAILLAALNAAGLCRISHFSAP